MEDITLDLYYIVEENGYRIFDKNDEFFHIHQYEPYILHKDWSYEENAKWHINMLLEQHQKMLEEIKKQEEGEIE